MASADLQEAETETPIPAGRTFLRRVRIRGYKSIAFCDVTLEPLTVLVGRNGCGKSNFLDALAFLRDAVKYDVREAVQRHGGWAAVACRTIDSPIIEFEIDVRIKVAATDGSKNGSKKHDETTEVTYSLQIVGGENIAPSVQFEKLVERSADGKIVTHFVRQLLLNGRINSVPISEPNRSTSIQLSLPEKKEMSLQAIRPESCMLGILEFPACLVLATAMRNAVFLHPNLDTIRRPQKPSSGDFLEKTGENLASVIRQFAIADAAWFARTNRYLNYIVREIDHFSTARIGEYETIRFVMDKERSSVPLEFDAAAMSDGTLRAVTFLVGVFHNIPTLGRPSLVGLEEPETALHPGAMNGLVDALDEATLASQIIITTHSPELLDNPTISVANVRAVEMYDGRTILGPVDATTVEIIQKKLDTLGGLERQHWLEVDLDDRSRQDGLLIDGSGR